MDNFDKKNLVEPKLSKIRATIRHCVEVSVKSGFGKLQVKSKLDLLDEQDCKSCSQVIQIDVPLFYQVDFGMFCETNM